MYTMENVLTKCIICMRCKSPWRTLRERSIPNSQFTFTDSETTNDRDNGNDTATIDSSGTATKCTKSVAAACIYTF